MTNDSPDLPPPLPRSAARARVPVRFRLAAAESTSRQMPAPQFGSIHLMLWIAGTGIYLATNRDLYATDLSPLGMLILICQVLPRGAAWAALAIFVGRQWKRAPWAIEPGEWLVAIAGMWLALEVVMMNLPAAQHFQNPVTVHAAVTCVLLVLPTLTQSLATDWKLFFAFLVAIFAWPVLVALVEADTTVYPDWIDRSGDIVLNCRFYLAAAALAVVVGRDVIRGVRHGWLHWAGLVDVVLIVLSAGLMWLLA
jgi:hypothetical protein